VTLLAFDPSCGRWQITFSQPRWRSSARAKLHALDDAPWGDLRGKPLDNLRLSRLLNPYGIKPKPVRIGGDVARGYVKEDLHDAWKRYLAQPVAKAVTPATHVTRDEP
jgi:hypothetical protein